ncbi:GTP-binding protein Obg, putative [Babesia ovis]|uniref:GTP-binding protein Obg, putative n=1 Tax=Babesia ovis TaxID=5869 RepID=A0A9W5TB58_BABOV|nr:GTP-binding protein Obg, putative [Babesia ovis]
MIFRPHIRCAQLLDTLKRHGLSSAQRRFFSDRSEAAYSRRIYCSEGKVEFGPPTYTFFTDNACLTMKVRNDETLGYKVMILSAMTREGSVTKVFDKRSRVSATLPMEEVDKLFDVVSSDSSESTTTLHGVDGGNLVISKSCNTVSLKLCPSLIPGINVTHASAPALASSKVHVNFVGGSNENALLIHALKELKDC